MLKSINQLSILCGYLFMRSSSSSPSEPSSSDSTMFSTSISSSISLSEIIYVSTYFLLIRHRTRTCCRQGFIFCACLFFPFLKNIYFRTPLPPPPLPVGERRSRFLMIFQILIHWRIYTPVTLSI